MEWSSIVGPLAAVGVFIIMRLLMRKKKQGGEIAEVENREEFQQHLHTANVEASLVKKGDDREKIGLGRASGQRSEGIIKLEDKHLDSINIVGISSQTGTHYFTDYLVKSPNIMGKRIPKKTTLVKKKSPPIVGQVVGIEWKGDAALAQSLNLDYSLEDKLLRASINDNFNGNIWIYPEPKHGYTRIRIDYLLPSTDLFGAISTIAKCIKSW